MWVYQKPLQHPVNIKNMDLKMAKYLITQFGGPNGELAASLRYLSQRYTMPTGKTRALLTDIGTEELAHVEMIASMVYQLTADATPEQLKAAGLDTNYAQNGFGIYPDSFITSKTFCFTSSVTGFESFITLDTVDIDTPAFFATSFIVIVLFIFTPSLRNTIYFQFDIFHLNLNYTILK